jgi:NADPH:quinone reductase-like Zn-dependent oxidoreductase
MRAAHTPSYGPADVLELREVPAPRVADDQVLVQIRASAVTAGDLRLRAADFPSVAAVLGRLAIGVLGPRRPIQGTMFAGRVTAVGARVTRWAVGDDVFGYVPSGAYAELLAVSEAAAIARMPDGVGYDEAAAVPYGGGTALYFLRELAGVRPGERVLVVGAAGGVGRFAVQVARHLGADVTAVCSPGAFALVRELGADHVVDRADDFTRAGRRYDVVFDVAGATTFSAARGVLRAGGRYLSLILSLGLLVGVALTALRRGPRAKFGVALATAATMAELRELMARGAVRATVARRFPLERIREAHAAAEAPQVHGSVVVTCGA